MAYKPWMKLPISSGETFATRDVELRFLDGQLLNEIVRRSVMAVSRLSASSREVQQADRHPDGCQMSVFHP